MPTFAESWRQSRQAPPVEEPSTFGQFFRQTQQPIAPEPAQEPLSFAKVWKTFRETPAVATTTALGRGVLGAASGLAGFSKMGNEWAGDLGIPVVSKRAREAADALEPVAAQLDEWQRSLQSEKDTGSPLERFKKDPVGTIPKALFETAPYMAAGAAGLGGAAAIAATRAGQEYRRLTGEGVLPDKARMAASLVGTTEAVLERIVPSRIIKGIDKDLIGRLVSQSGMEAGTEFLQHYPSVIADLATGLREGSLTRQDFYDALEDALMGGAVGAVAGAATPRLRTLGPDAAIRDHLRQRVVVGDDVPTKIVTESTPERLYTALVNKQQPLEINTEIGHAVERSRGTPMIASMPFKQGVFEVDSQGEMIRDPVTNAPIQKARSLDDILRGVNLDHLRMLLVAEQDLELASQGKAGTQPQYSLDGMSLLQQRLGADLPKLQGVAGEFRDWLAKSTIDPLIDVGVLTLQDKAAMLAKNQFYSPMIKVFDDIDEITMGAGTKQFQGQGQPIKGRKTSFGPGGDTKILDPLEVAYRRVPQIAKFVERQRVANLVVDKFLTDPALQGDIELVPVQPYERVTKAGTQMLRPQPQNTVYAFKDGKKNFYRLPEPITEAINSYTGKQMNFFMDKILAPAARMARAGFTYAADFAAAATLKDQWEAYVFSPGLNPAKSFIPFVSPGEAIGHMLGQTDLYKEYMQAGAGHGSLVAGDRKDVADLMELRYSGSFLKRNKRFLNPVTLLAELGNASSEASRLGVYAAMKRRGQTIGEARHSSRFALSDFVRKGTAGEDFNKVTAFWNAQVQGLDKFARTFNPVRLASKDAKARGQAWTSYTKALTSVTLPSVLLWMKNHDDEDYQRLPTWEKNTYWHVGKFDMDKVSQANPAHVFLKKIKTGQYWLRIPKPFELGWVFGSLPERMLDYVKTKNPAQLLETLPEFVDSLAPGIIPTLATPLIENWANKSFYFGTPIIPHGTENQPPEEQYTERTPQLIRDAAGAVGKIPGMGPILGQDLRSPAQVENLTYGLTGTLGRDAVSAADAALYGTRAEAGLPLDPKRLPLLRRFTSPADPNLGAQPIRDMFKEINRVDGLATTVSSKVRAGKEEEAREFAKRFPEWKGAKWLRQRRKVYIDHRKVWERIRNSDLPADEKLRRLKIQEDKMVKTAEVTLDGWREYLADLKE